MRKWSLLVFMVLVGASSSAQIIDSLKAVLPFREGTERLNVLLDLSFEYIGRDNKEALRVARQVYPIARDQRDSARMIRACRFMGYALRRLGKSDSASRVYRHLEGLAEARNDTAELIWALNSHGLTLMQSSKYDQSLKNHFRSMLLAEHAGDSSSVASNLNNIGLIYYKLKDYTKAIVYFKRCLSLGILKNKPEFRHQLKLNIAISNAYLKNYDVALNYINDVWHDCQADCSNATLIMSDFNAGVTYFGMKQLRTANRYFIQSLDRAKAEGDVRFQLDNLIYLAQIAIQELEPAKAINILNQCQELIDAGSDLTLEEIKVYNQFFRAYGQLNDFANATRYQRKYIDLKDSVFNEFLTTSLMKVEAEYLEKENVQKIKAQNEALALRQHVIDRQRWVNLLSGVAIVSLFVILISLLQRNRQRRLMNEMLEGAVRDRTMELEKNQRELIRACRERDLLIDRTSLDVSESVATMKGLANLGQSLQQENEPRLREGFQKVSNRLNAALSALKSSQERSAESREGLNHN